MQSIAIFCGSSSGNDTHYIESAQLVGEYLAQHDIILVYGGGKVGLMGAVADSALASGGKVIGVMPKNLVDREIAHEGLTELHVVANMHERKYKMAELADGFIALAGGAGTLEEISEQWTWAQLGIHQKPCAFLNTLGYYDPLIEMITRLAHQEDMLGKAQLCLIDLRRVLTFLSRPRALGSHIYDADIRELNEDVRSLVEHNAFLFQKVRFLMDTTSGFINTEQSDTIKRFSILPSMLAPPMLIASIYGMNTDVLPFAHGTTSFIIVALLILMFFIGPILYFRWKKWI